MGPISVCKEFISLLKESENSRIINISSSSVTILYDIYIYNDMALQYVYRKVLKTGSINFSTDTNSACMVG